MHKLLIANRGEIACRIMRSARELGISTVAVYSDADRHALHVELADEAVRLGLAPAQDSYLDTQKILHAAQQTGADAIHPGYGFLSENARFANACQAAGITFVGPPASAIEAMGSKSAAKAIMADAEVPILPGYHGDDCSAPTLLKAAQTIGFPVLLKASAGGGGKGMRIVADASEFEAAFAATQREARKAFDDDHLLVEKYVVNPRHVEVQVFFDSQGNGIYLGDRDCSLQRRHQKVIEEAPAPGIAPEVRKAMGEAAVRCAAAINYVGAGTVEFLLAADQQFYFMEMNTRLQVEHPVTEMVTGVDLVAWQLEIAGGAPLPLKQQDVQLKGHAMEARLYAEDTANGFLPMTGQITHLSFPGGPLRVDTGVRPGDEVSVHYDPMIAKVIAYAEDRDLALTQLMDGLSQCHISPLVTNTDFLIRLLDHAQFRAAALSTQFIDAHLPDLLTTADADEITRGALYCALWQLLVRQQSHTQGDASPWAIADGFRLNEPPYLVSEWRYHDQHFEVRGTLTGNAFVLQIEEQQYSGYAELDGTTLSVELEQADSVHVRRTIVVAETRAGVTLFTHTGRLDFACATPDLGDADTHSGSGDASAPMNGTVVSILVAEGDTVTAGDTLLIVEAMKMEHAIKAELDGEVTAIHCEVGQLVEGGAVLINITAGDSADAATDHA